MDLRGIAEGGCRPGLPTFAAGAVLTALAVGLVPGRHAVAAGTALPAVPILIQAHLSDGLAYRLNRRLGVAWCVPGPPGLIGASDCFELAVSAAIAPFTF